MLESHREGRVNFTKSNLYWGGPSKGLFKLVAVLTMEREGSSTDKVTYCLGQSVLAGNMYVEKGLLKKPTYLFQVTGSLDEQIIFRTFIPNQERKKMPNWMKKKDSSGDTYGKPLFEEFFVD